MTLETTNVIGEIVSVQHGEPTAPYHVDVRRAAKIAGSKRLEAVTVAVHRVGVIAKRLRQRTRGRESWFA